MIWGMTTRWGAAGSHLSSALALHKAPWRELPWPGAQAGCSWDLSDTLCGVKQRDGKIRLFCILRLIWSNLHCPLGRLFMVLLLLVKSERRMQELENFGVQKNYSTLGLNLLTNIHWALHCRSPWIPLEVWFKPSVSTAWCFLNLLVETKIQGWPYSIWPTGGGSLSELPMK
jgi:hypothetical protein